MDEPLPFLGEIRLMAFSPAPLGWAPCEGQLLPIKGNEPLFSLLGTFYGGDGRTTFGLPDMRDRVPVDNGPGFSLSWTGGHSTSTLAPLEMPEHTHVAAASDDAATTADPTGALWANAGIDNYAPSSNVTMAAGDVSTVGGNQPHENLSPVLTVNFCIALQGAYPSEY